MRLPRAPRALVLAAIGAAALTTSAARAEPKAPPPDPSLYIDPKYNPDAHGGLPYATYLRVTRGQFRRSTGMMVTGIVLVGLGSSTMALGTGIYAAAHGCSADSPPFAGGGGQSCSARPGQVSGMAILLTGTIATVLGIPLWVVGASDVPFAESGVNERVPARSARLVPVITPAVTNRGVALTWQF